MRYRVPALVLLGLLAVPATAQLNEGLLSAPASDKLTLPTRARPSPATEAPVPVAAPTPRTDTGYVYRMGSGDRLRIEVYGEDKLTGEFVVNGEGTVSFPLLGDVPARGQTVAGFRAALIKRLASEYLRNPSVTAEVVNFRPVFILGEVAKPGEFAYAENMTVYGLVAKAGGFTYRANQKMVFIRREGDPRETRDVLEAGTLVRPGDTIRIGQRYF